MNAGEVSAKRCPYVVLGVEKGATLRKLKASYLQLAMKHHPDTGEEPSTERFKEIPEAWELLSDPQRKSIYDQFGFAATERMASSTQEVEKAVVELVRSSFGKFNVDNPMRYMLDHVDSKRAEHKRLKASATAAHAKLADQIEKFERENSKTQNDMAKRLVLATLESMADAARSEQEYQQDMITLCTKILSFLSDLKTEDAESNAKWGFRGHGSISLNSWG